MGVLQNKAMLAVAILALVGAAQVHAAMYHCRAINVCDGTEDPKWTQQTVDDAFSKFGAAVAYNWKPPTKTGCLAKKCSTPVTVTLKTAVESADSTLLDEYVAATIADPSSLSKLTACVEDATAALIAKDKSCAAFKPVGFNGNVLCRSTKVCSNYEDFKWVEVEASKKIAAFLKKAKLATSGISITPAVSVDGCSCKSPATITVTAKVPLAADFSALDSKLAATLASLASPLKAACIADATSAYLAAHPLCKKPVPAPAKPIKPAATTVCRDVSLCDNTVDFAWTKVAAEDAFAPLYKSLGVPLDAAHFTVTKVAGKSLKAGSVSCTCSTRALVKITVPATGGAAAKVDAFIASVKASLSSVQCLASATSKTCKQPGASSGISTCRAWTLADDNADWKWTVSTVKSRLAPCLSATGTPASGLTITRAAGTCATIAGAKCCGANIATVKVTGVPAGQDSAFGVCARAALTVASLGKPFKCSGTSSC